MCFALAHRNICITDIQTEASFEYFEQNPGSVEVDGNLAINFSWALASFSSDEMCGKGGILEEHTDLYRKKMKNATAGHR